MFFSQLISRLLDFNIERLEGLQLLICNLSMFIPSWAGARARWWSISTQIYGVWASKMEPSLPPTKVTLCHNANWYPTLVQYSQWTECTSWYRFPHQWHHSKHPNVLQNFVHHSHFLLISWPSFFLSRNLNINKSSTENFVAQASWELVTTRTPRLSRPFWCSQICRPSAEKSWEMYEEKKNSKNCPPQPFREAIFYTLFLVRDGQWFYETLFCCRPDSIIDMVDIKDAGWLSSPMDSPNEPTSCRSSTNFLHGASLPLVRKAAGAFSDFFGHLHVDALGVERMRSEGIFLRKGDTNGPSSQKKLSEQSIWCLVNDSDVNPALIWDMHTFIIYTYIVLQTALT